MVTVSRVDGETVIMVKPNHSSSWRQNLWLLAALAIPSLGAGIGFAVAGAWPILPLAGIELLALGSALYWVNWKLEYRHVIRFTDNIVMIDKGYFIPKRSWHFSRPEAALRITPETHPWQGPALSVHDRLAETRVGEFLNRDETLELMNLLKQQLSVRTHSGTDTFRA